MTNGLDRAFTGHHAMEMTDDTTHPRRGGSFFLFLQRILVRVRWTSVDWSFFSGPLPVPFHVGFAISSPKSKLLPDFKVNFDPLTSFYCLICSRAPLTSVLAFLAFPGGFQLNLILMRIQIGSVLRILCPLLAWSCRSFSGLWILIDLAVFAPAGWIRL